MKRLLSGKSLAVLAALAIIGSATVAVADWGSSFGRRGCDGGGYHRGPYMQGTDVTDEQIQKFDEERAKFYRMTQDVRQQLYEKELSLRAEFAKKNPDAAKAASIQKEISELNSKMDQMQLEHRLEMKKIDPNLGCGGYRWGDDDDHHGGYRYHRSR